MKESQGFKQRFLENSPGAQLANFNLETHGYTAFNHGHHLLIPERYFARVDPLKITHLFLKGNADVQKDPVKAVKPSF